MIAEKHVIRHYSRSCLLCFCFLALHTNWISRWTLACLFCLYISMYTIDDRHIELNEQLHDLFCFFFSIQSTLLAGENVCCYNHMAQKTKTSQDSCYIRILIQTHRTSIDDDRAMMRKLECVFSWTSCVSHNCQYCGFSFKSITDFHWRFLYISIIHMIWVKFVDGNTFYSSIQYLTSHKSNRFEVTYHFVSQLQRFCCCCFQWRAHTHTQWKSRKAEKVLLRTWFVDNN